MQSKNILVVYHENCADGFGAALSAWLKFGETAEYLPYQYGKAPPDVKGKHLYVLDFSFDREVMEVLDKEAASITVLDHHKTSAKKLQQYVPACCGKIHFDMSQSGAMLAWRHFHPETPAPHLIRCIQDRDIWKWEVENSEAYLTWLDTQPFDMPTWAAIAKHTKKEIVAVTQKGEQMQIKFKALADSILDNVMPIRLAGVDGLMLNTNHPFTNYAGVEMAQKSGTFGMTWSLRKNGTIKVSLRSVAPYDVSVIAEKFPGGGGHAQAASFSVSGEKLGDLAKGVLAPDV